MFFGNLTKYNKLDYTVLRICNVKLCSAVFIIVIIYYVQLPFRSVLCVLNIPVNCLRSVSVNRTSFYYP